MSDSSPSDSSKPTPRFLSYQEAMRQFRITAAAHRELCTLLVRKDLLSPAEQATLLSLSAVVQGSDGES